MIKNFSFLMPFLVLYLFSTKLSASSSNSNIVPASGKLIAIKDKDHLHHTAKFVIKDKRKRLYEIGMMYQVRVAVSNDLFQEYEKKFEKSHRKDEDLKIALLDYYGCTETNDTRRTCSKTRRENTCADAVIPVALKVCKIASYSCASSGGMTFYNRVVSERELFIPPSFHTDENSIDTRNLRSFLCRLKEGVLLSIASRDLPKGALPVSPSLSYCSIPVDGDPSAVISVEETAWLKNILYNASYGEKSPDNSILFLCKVFMRMGMGANAYYARAKVDGHYFGVYEIPNEKLLDLCNVRTLNLGYSSATAPCVIFDKDLVSFEIVDESQLLPDPDHPGCYVYQP